MDYIHTYSIKYHKMLSIRIAPALGGNWVKKDPRAENGRKTLQRRSRKISPHN